MLRAALAVLLASLLPVISSAQSVEMGALERLPSKQACLAFVESLAPARMLTVNGHQAPVRASKTFPWVVDTKQGATWCRDGVNRVRADRWTR